MKNKVLDELQSLMKANRLSIDFPLILDNDDVCISAGLEDENIVEFRTDPTYLLRDLLDDLGIPWQEA